MISKTLLKKILAFGFPVQLPSRLQVSWASGNGTDFLSPLVTRAAPLVQGLVADSGVQGGTKKSYMD